MHTMVMTLSLIVVKMFLGPVTGFKIIEEDIIERHNDGTSLVKLYSSPAATKTWESGVIPVFIDKSITSRNEAYKNVTLALDMVASMTNHCVSFPNKSDTDEDYVNITGVQDGCFSDVGHIGGQQILNLGPRCGSIGIIMHEILHTLGIWHEQSRIDRDIYVDIDYSNIIPGEKKNFNKRNETKEMVKDVGYDLKSIMHYKFNAFALDRNEPTIIPDPRYGVKKESLGQRKNLTDLDIQKIVWLYYCAICKNYVADNVVSVPDIETFKAGSTVKFQCQDEAKYRIIGASSRACGRNGNWTGAAPMCVPISNLSRRSIIYDNSEEFQMIHRSSASRPQTWMIIPKWIKITTGYGPDADHTYGTHYPAHGPDKGRFYYFNSTDLNRGENATLQTKLLRNKRSSNTSIVFFYYINGNGVGKLNVTLHRHTGGWKSVELWTSNITTRHGSWYCVHITAENESRLNLSGFYFIKFTAVRGSNKYATIAIDDIFVGSPVEVDTFATLQKCGEERAQDYFLDNGDPPRRKYK